MRKSLICGICGASFVAEDREQKERGVCNECILEEEREFEED